MTITPHDSLEDRARGLRALYRDRPPQRRARFGHLVFDPGEQARHWHAVKAEYARLFPDRAVRLDAILASAHVEGRELAGQRYDNARQAWVGPDGTIAW